ncbi:MAG: acyltransferase [Mobilitalea sp.]
MNSFYSEDELKEIGFAQIGTNVLISKKTSFYGTDKMTIGSNVRIDDYCVLSGKIDIGNYVHIAVFNAIFGGVDGIVFEDYSGISSRCAIYATTDDYSGEFMTNPTIPPEYTNVINKRVEVGKYVVIGTGSTVLPGVIIGEGCSFGAMTLITRNTEPWGFYMGLQCIRLKERSKKLLDYEKKLMDKYRRNNHD